MQAAKSNSTTPSGQPAFTLVELLVVIAVLSVLAGIALPIMGAARERSKQMREVQGARQVITAWMLYANENDQTVLPGYKTSPGTTNASGTVLKSPLNARYPFRLGPYLNHNYTGTVLVNEQAGLSDDYAISLTPSLGLNVTFVGGDHSGDSDLVPNAANEAKYGSFAVTKLPQIHSPSMLLVFASAKYSGGSFGDYAGHHSVKSPYFWARRWADTYEPGGNSWNTLSVDFRFNGRAVCAMADGHVEMLDFEQLEDMRRWSNQAAIADDPEWVMQPQ